MKSFFVLITLLMISLAISAQNLVPNGSFETIDPNPSVGCPTGNCCRAGDSFYSAIKPQYWENVWPIAANASNDDTGDYYNPCTASIYNYPGSNFLGCELPLDGKSYYGFVAVDLNNPPIGNEFVKNKNIPLVANQQYYVEFYVSNAEGPNGGYPDYAVSNAFVKHIGAFFINEGAPGQQLPQTLDGITSLYPQIPNT